MQISELPNLFSSSPQTEPTACLGWIPSAKSLSQPAHETHNIQTLIQSINVHNPTLRQQHIHINVDFENQDLIER
jgi:hypothetical protein